MMRYPCFLIFRTLRSPPSFAHRRLIPQTAPPYLHRRKPGELSPTRFRSTTPSGMKANGVLYEPIEDVERMEYCRTGGYHPVTIGCCFQNRYQVVHKLGHGTFSTIWLARDIKSQRYVAVKVCIAESSPLELDILTKLSGAEQLSNIDGSGTTMIPLVLDTFNIQGPNGTHICLVTSPARASLSDIKMASWISLFQLDVARALIAQLVIGIQYIHSQGVVHGDLHCGNTLLQLPQGFDQLSTEKLYELYGEPVLEPVNRLDGQTLPPGSDGGVPQHAVLPIWLGKASEKITLPEAKILLSDFGESFCPSQGRKFKSNTPLPIRPPEARFEPTKPLSFASDVWTLACTMWDVIAQRSLFEGLLTNEDDMTCQQIAALGPLPVEWQERWREEARLNCKAVSEFEERITAYQSWDELFEASIQQPRMEEGKRGVLPPPALELAERDALSAMLRSMLSFRPEDRPSTQQILESEWMVRWALPEYDRIRNTG